MDGFTELTIDKLANREGINELNRMLIKLFDNISGDGDSVRIYKGYGTPEGVVTAGVGSIYMRLDGGTGTAQYRKESGTGATGWVVTSNGLDIGALDEKTSVAANDLFVIEDSADSYIQKKVKGSKVIPAVYSRYLSCVNPNPIQNLTASDMGKLIFAGGSNSANVTLPLASTISSGDIVTIIAQNSVTTISRNGSDNIYKDGVDSPVTSVLLTYGKAYKFVAYNSSIWLYVIES